LRILAVCSLFYFGASKIKVAQADSAAATKPRDSRVTGFINDDHATCRAGWAALVFSESSSMARVRR
jgi:hypothetical protein